MTRSLLEAYTGDERGEPAVNPAQRPVSDLMRAPLVLCSPDTSIREAAQQMADERATSVVVDLGDDGLGIMTDRDLRSRVIAAGVDSSAPVSQVMSAPAYTVAADRRGSEVLLDMLERGIRHFPVVSPTGRVVGVVEDSDLVAVATRSSFHLRAAIARARHGRRRSPRRPPGCARRSWRCTTRGWPRATCPRSSRSWPTPWCGGCSS